MCGVCHQMVYPDSWFVTGTVIKAVFTLDASGKLCDKININTDSYVRDCTVVDGKLWVGCDNGDIAVLSPVTQPPL